MLTGCLSCNRTTDTHKALRWLPNFCLQQPSRLRGFMSCERSKDCVYYRTHPYKSSSRQSRFLVDNYCEGTLHPRCRRLQYKTEFCKEAPEDLAPNGYLVGTHTKLKTESTRKFERYKIKAGACMLQVLGTKKTFSAWIVDISEGGVRLELNIHPKELNICPENSFLKILGYPVDAIPFSLTKEVVKPIWQNNHAMGCSFVPSPV